MRFRGRFAHVAGQLADGELLPLCRLRHGGSAGDWGFALYRAGHDDYEPAVLRSGYTAGAPEDALDCACSLYLSDPARLPAGTPVN